MSCQCACAVGIPRGTYASSHDAWTKENRSRRPKTTPMSRKIRPWNPWPSRSMHLMRLHESEERSTRESQIKARNRWLNPGSDWIPSILQRSSAMLRQRNWDAQRTFFGPVIRLSLSFLRTQLYDPVSSSFIRAARIRYGCNDEETSARDVSLVTSYLRANVRSFMISREKGSRWRHCLSDSKSSADSSSVANMAAERYPRPLLRTIFLAWGDFTGSNAKRAVLSTIGWC